MFLLLLEYLSGSLDFRLGVLVGDVLGIGSDRVGWGGPSETWCWSGCIGRLVMLGLMRQGSSVL